MRTAILGAAILAGLLGAPACAMAAGEAVAGNYVQVSVGSAIAGETELDVVGLGSADLDLDAGLFFAGAVGHSWPTGLAMEVEGVWLDNDVDTDDIDVALGVPLNASARTAGLLLNVQYAIADIGGITPVVGAGVGFGKTKYKLLGESDGSTNLMWQVMAGFSVPMNETFSWDVKYRFIKGPEFDVSASDGVTTITSEVETSAHVVAIGGRFKF